MNSGNMVEVEHAGAAPASTKPPMRNNIHKDRTRTDTAPSFCVAQMIWIIKANDGAGCVSRY